MVSQPAVRQALDASGLSRALTLDVGEAGLPDLAITGVTAPATARIGQPIAVSWTVHNRGGAPIDRAYFDGAVLSSVPTFDGANATLGTYNQQQGIGSDARYSESEVFTVPVVAPGSYFLVVRADVFNLLPETDKSNNDQAVRITIER